MSITLLPESKIIYNVAPTLHTECTACLDRLDYDGCFH